MERQRFAYDHPHTSNARRTRKSVGTRAVVNRFPTLQKQSKNLVQPWISKSHKSARIYKHVQQFTTSLCNKILHQPKYVE